MDPATERLVRESLTNKIQWLRRTRGYSLEEAAQRIKRENSDVPTSGKIIDEIILDNRQRIQIEVAENTKYVSRDNRDRNWFAPFTEADQMPRAWNLYRDKLRHDPGMSDAVETIDGESNCIVASLADPSKKVKSKGLVLGYVQSGKTANYTAVIAKAVASGYRFIVVLAGMYNNLRAQTQARLAMDLSFDDPIAVISPDGSQGIEWLALTGASDEDGDKDLPRQDSRARQILASPERFVVIAVVKKQRNRLENLRDLLGETRPEALNKCPVLIIDDESDQATPNTKRDDEDPSAINRLVREIWEKVTRGTYVAYTATPFANLLMNPNEETEMYPSDFIYAMKKPEGYMGSEEFFGNSLADGGSQQTKYNRLREISREESDQLSMTKNALNAGFTLECPESLEEAIKWFIIATAIRRTREHDNHSSMLIHLSHLVAHHDIVAEKVESYLATLRKEWADNREDCLDALEETFKRETDAVAFGLAIPLSDAESMTWGDVSGYLDEVLGSLAVIVDNGQSEQRLEYDDQNPRPLIVIGGNTLSRGLTLKDLVCSYFDRRSSAYDTLLQMGRWFGYRHGYEDLVRVWATQDIKNDFSFLAGIEIELREEIQSLIDDGLRPRDIGLKIRQHPGHLEVTARTKMYHANQVQLSLQERRLQTHRFSQSKDVIKENRQTFETLLARMQSEGKLPEESVTASKRHLVFRNVSANYISEFFRDFKIAQTGLRSLQPEITSQWMEKFGKDRKWNVVLVDGNSKSNTVVGGYQVHLTNRARYEGPDQNNEVSVKGLISPSDLGIDLNQKIADNGVRSLMKARRDQLDGAGVLLLYLIDGHSQPDDRYKITRYPLDIDVDVPAFAVVFPRLRDSQNDATFIAVQPDAPTDCEEE